MIEPVDDLDAISLSKESSILTIEPLDDFEAISFIESL